jgi:hypothetical protein
VTTRRLVQLVADYGPGDLAFAEMAQLLEFVVPDADVRLTRVPARDTLAAGWCAASLALCEGPPGRLVVVDVTASGGARHCVGRARDGVEIVGPNGGWTWSLLAAEVCGPCYLEVPARDGLGGAPQLLAQAVVRVAGRQPHGVREPVPHEEIPAVPDSVVAFVDCDGSLETTIPHRADTVGRQMQVRIGDVTATAFVTDGSPPPQADALALQPVGSTRGGGRPFSALTLRGGSAAELFRSPPGGATVALGAPAGG